MGNRHKVKNFWEGARVSRAPFYLREALKSLGFAVPLVGAAMRSAC